jgi:type IV pilus assembly protein PilM
VRKVLPIGVDIGTCSVKMVQLSLSGGGCSVVACARAELPDLAGLAPEARETALVARVREALKAHKFRGNDCISALLDSEVHIRNIRVPCVREEEMDGVVAAEARSKFPFNTDQAVLNYMVAGEVPHGEDARLEVILFAAPREAVELHVARLHRMGLMPASLDVQHCAMFRTFERYLRRREDEDDVNVFVDLGGLTKVVITRGRDVLFIKNIEKGALAFNEAVAARLNLGLSEAKALRRRAAKSPEGGQAADGEGCDPEIRQALFDAIRPEVEELADEINKCLRYHTVTFRGARPNYLTFIGGETHEGNIPTMLGERLGLPVVIGQPFRGIDTSRLGPDLDRRGMLSEWTVAFGLSLKGAYIRGYGLGQRLAG